MVDPRDRRGARVEATSRFSKVSRRVMPVLAGAAETAAVSRARAAVTGLMNMAPIGLYYI